MRRLQLISKLAHQFNTDKDHSAKKKVTGRLDSFLDGFGMVKRTVPANSNTENNYNFKSSTILQTDTWKKGLEVVLPPNSTLVMTASTRSKREVPLQESTLVMFESKTSTGSDKTHQEHQELETQSGEKNMQEYKTSSNP